MISALNTIADKISSKNGMKKSDFVNECKECSLILDDSEMDIAISYFEENGLKIVQKGDTIYSKTRFTSYKEEIFCVVDIETNGNSPKSDQIIEIGAVKYKNGKIIDRFETFVCCDFVPDYIQRITNISREDLIGAPSLKEVLYKFREFLGSSIFVAHNVRFDYNFISDSLKRFGKEDLLNRRLCTINLAKKTIKSERYGLSFLKEHLNIDTGEHHRAYADALSALKIFELSLKSVPKEIKTTEELIEFSNPPKRKRRKREP